MKKIFTLLLFLGVTVFGQTTYINRAADDASNYGTWSGNGGTGFNAWVFTNSGSGSKGQIIESAYNTSINVIGKSFGMYANPFGNTAKAKRTFSPLKENEKLTFKLSVRYRNGRKGVDILSGSTVLFNINIANDKYTYQNLNGGTTQEMDAFYDGNVVFTVTIIKKSGNDINVTIERSTVGHTGLASTNFTVTSGTIDGLEFYVQDTDIGPDNNLYLNSLSIGVPQYTSAASTDWNTGSSWTDGTVPVKNARIVIDHDVTVNSAVSASAGNITINSGKSLTFGASGELSVDGDFSNSGTLNMSSGGTINFFGFSTVSGTNPFNNLVLTAGVNFGASSTVNGTLQINAGGYITTNAPTYGTNSILKYNSGTTYGRGTEWSATSGKGYPYNVQISNNTTLDVGANSGTGIARNIANNLTVDAGSGLQLAGSNPMTKEVRVLNDVSNSGTITLSTSSGGDLYIGGNFTNSGTFTHNSRLVSFNGSSSQTITGETSFGYLTVNDVTLANNISVANTLTINSSKTLTCNDKTITVGGGGAINNSGTFSAGTGKVIFATGGTSTVTGTVTFNNVDLSGGANFGAGSTVNGTLDIKNGGFVSSDAPTYGTNSTLKYSSGTVYDRFTEWLSTGGHGLPYNVLITNNTTVNLAANSGINQARSISGSLTIDAGSTLRMQAPNGDGMNNTLTINGDILNNGTLTLSTADLGNLIVNGSFTQNGTLDCKARTVSGSGSFTLSSGATLKVGSATGVNGNITTSTKTLSSGASYEFNGTVAQVTGSDLTTTVNKLIINNSAGVSLSQATEVTTELGLTSGNLSLGSDNLTLGSSATISGTYSASNKIVATGTGKLRKMYTANGSFTFPVGDASKYTPVTVNFTGGTLDATTYAEVKLTASAHPNRNTDNNNYLKRYWTINSNVASPAAQVTIQYDDNDINGSEASFVVGRWTGTAWVNPTFVSRDPVANTITANTTGFSDFTGGDAGALPVELTSFNAALRNGMVDLKWETKTEINNYGFEVERKSATADWSKIGFVEGYGSTNSPKYYSYSDKPSGTGKFSYRLKQIDNDGAFEYSPVVEVLVDNLPNGFVLEQNYPNPFNPETSIRFALKEDTKASLKVFNAMGEEVATLFDGIAEAGRYYDVKFSGNDLSSGFYIYKLVAGEYVSVKKMLLMK